MSVVFDALVQLLLTGFAVLVYGTPEKPRHVVWRGILRTVVFSGAALGLLGMFAVEPLSSWPKVLLVLWLFPYFILIQGEHEFGNKRVLLSAVLVGLAITAAALRFAF